MNYPFSIAKIFITTANLWVYTDLPFIVIKEHIFYQIILHPFNAIICFSPGSIKNQIKIILMTILQVNILRSILPLPYFCISQHFLGSFALWHLRVSARGSIMDCVSPPNSYFDALTSNMMLTMGFPGGSVAKNMPANEWDTGLIPGSERSPGEGTGNPLQYSCLRNPMRATVHVRLQSVESQKSWTWFSD